MATHSMQTHICILHEHTSAIIYEHLTCTRTCPIITARTAEKQTFLELCVVRVFLMAKLFRPLTSNEMKCMAYMLLRFPSEENRIECACRNPRLACSELRTFHRKRVGLSQCATDQHKTFVFWHPKHVRISNVRGNASTLYEWLAFPRWMMSMLFIWYSYLNVNMAYDIEYIELAEHIELCFFRKLRHHDKHATAGAMIHKYARSTLCTFSCEICRLNVALALQSPRKFSRASHVAPSFHSGRTSPSLFGNFFAFVCACHRAFVLCCIRKV